MRDLETLEVGVEMESEPVSDWAKENARGRDHADDVISNMQSQQNPTLLGNAAKKMIAKGVFGGFEVGFFHQIAMRTN